MRGRMSGGLGGAGELGVMGEARKVAREQVGALNRWV